MEVYKNGALLATRSVTAWQYYDDGGYTGLWDSNVSSAQVDDFGGGNVVAGPTPTPTASATPTQTSTPMHTPTMTNTPTNTSLVTNTPTNTSTNTATPTRTNTPTNTATATSSVNTITLQPNGADGLDTFILSSSAATNYGTQTFMGVGEDNSATNSVGRSLIKFDLSSLPANATITSAALSIWTDLDLSSNTRTIRVYRLKVPFNETQATWNIRASGSNWQTSGASGTNDRESVEIGSVQVLSNEASGTEKQISLSASKIQELLDGTFANNGFIIVADTELNDGFTYKTSDHATSSQRPKLVIQYQVSSSTSTPTPTASVTPSQTATLTPTSTLSPTPTVTPTPSTPVLTSATFLYDGDGKRVKSIMNMGVGTNTTYFVGAHFEVVETYTGTQVNKYYYAGAQRIALRTDGTLNYLLGDHLGSTSLTTDANGVVISELRYKAWGETRYASGTTPTKYQYTGQYSYAADFGLMFYNARWYDSSLSRFAQADTIVPGGIQGLDRYAYVNNSPINYTDPSGHEPGACQDSALVNGSWVCNPTLLQSYGVSTDGLNEQQQQNALEAATNFGQYFYQTYGSQYGFTSPQDAFKKLTGGNISIILDDSRSDCITDRSTITCNAASMTMKAFVHEFVHVMDKYYQSKGVQVTAGCGGACLASSNLPFDYYTKKKYTVDAYKCRDNYYLCISHPDNPNVGPDQDGYYSYEAFANAGENLILGTLGIDLANNGFDDTDGGRAVEGWMNDWMPTFLNGIIFGVSP